MSNVLHPNEVEFNEIIKKNEVVFIDFYASWCGPCKMLAPEIEKLAEAYAGKVAVLKVDVDKEPNLAARSGVQSIPNLFLIKKGILVNSVLGYQPYPKLVNFIEGK